MDIGNIVGIAALVFGFGMVIFIHEMGHFLAAKWVGIKVEQFAIGFGHAICSWRKGVSFRWGSSVKEYEQSRKAETDGINRVDPNALGETEYRLNWLPLGGYVKMLGQDDLNPNSWSDDPRSYNRKPVRSRMVVVSAGVIMNVILAAALFMVVFLMGFHVPPAVIGVVLPQSPAQKAGLEVGDRDLTFDGDFQYDYTKLQLNVALARPDQDIPMVVLRDGKEVRLTVRPQKDPGTTFLAIGVDRTYDLAGDPRFEPEKTEKDSQLGPGEVVTAINGQPVAITDYPKFYHAMQQSYGAPVRLTVKDKGGAERQVTINPEFAPFFGEQVFQIAGMEPATRVMALEKGSPADGPLQKGDIILAIGGAKQAPRPVGREDLIAEIYKHGDAKEEIQLTILRGDEASKQSAPILPSLKLKNGHGNRGIGIAPAYAADTTVVAAIAPDSPAAAAGITPGSRIVSINDKPVKTWYDIHQLLLAGGARGVQAGDCRR